MMTSTSPVLDRITIHPVKSLDGMELEQARISEGGCLLHDREFMLLDADGEPVIGKSNELVHTLRSRIDLDAGVLSLRREGETAWNAFSLDDDRERLHAWLSEHFGRPIELVRDTTGRFLDIPDLSGVTVVSTSSLEGVKSWFPEMDLPQTRRRFRSTLEIAGVPPFWEDQLFADDDHVVEFTIGEVTLLGISPRARCVVPTRHPSTGETARLFPRTFANGRDRDLPSWSSLRRDHSHGYYLTVNCLIPATEIGKTLRLGDPLTIVDRKRPFER